MTGLLYSVAVTSVFIKELSGLIGDAVHCWPRGEVWYHFPDVGSVTGYFVAPIWLWSCAVDHIYTGVHLKRSPQTISPVCSCFTLCLTCKSAQDT